jgi:hypothetical protein
LWRRTLRHVRGAGLGYAVDEQMDADRLHR